MKFTIQRDGNDILSAHLGKIKLEITDEHTVLIEDQTFSRCKISELPENVDFSIFYTDKGLNYPINLPYKINRINQNEVRITIEENQRRKYWDGLFNIQHIVEKQANIIKGKNNMKIIEYYDQDDYITLEYQIDMLFIQEENLAVCEIFNYIHKITKELYDEAERNLKIDIVKEMMNERKQA